MWTRSPAVAALLLSAVAPLRGGDGKDKADAPQVFRGTLDPKDPPDRLLKKSPHKVHEVEFQAGKRYRIDLQSKEFEAFLRLEDGQGKRLAHHDGGGQDAWLLFAPQEGGAYR